ncbi:MAG: hypothetical protein K6F82_00955 [Sphaerochaetaceae bacterium]|nr:hypothetical protein [Sphaerochaetaceae bacterium]
MRKISVFLIVSVLLLLVLSSCSTMIGINTLSPSSVDLTGYRTIAVASVKPYDYAWRYRNAAYPETAYDTTDIPTPSALTQFINFIDWSVPYEDTAEYLTGVVEDALDQGIYTVINSSSTDRIISMTAKSSTVRQSLLDYGVDALVTGKVTAQNYRTFITASVTTDSSSGKKTYYYYLNREGNLRYEYVVQDVETLAVLDTYSFTGSAPLYETETVLIGYLNPDGNFVYSDTFTNSTVDFVAKFRDMADSFGSVIKKRLTPYYTRSNFYLVSNKSKDVSLEVAFEYAKNDMYYEACSIFEEHWGSYHDYVSGYNTAILYYVTGRQEEGIEMANTVFRATGEKDALKLYKKLLNIYEKNKIAESQIYGEKGSSLSSQDVIL